MRTASHALASAIVDQVFPEVRSYLDLAKDVVATVFGETSCDMNDANTALAVTAIAGLMAQIEVNQRLEDELTRQIILSGRREPDFIPPEHRMTCRDCQQTFDMRDLAAVGWHEQFEHKPSPAHLLPYPAQLGVKNENQEK